MVCVGVGGMNDCIAMVNGALDRSIDGQDRGLLYGHGLFETLRVCHDRVPLLDLHLARLLRDCDALRIAPPSEPQLRAQVAQILELGKQRWRPTNSLQARLKIGYRPDAQARPTVILQLFARRFEPPAYITARVCETRLSHSALAGIKHCNRLEQVLAAQELVAGKYFEGVMCNMADEVIEGVSSNVVVLRDGRCLTPAITSAGVAGVMRQYLIAQGRLEIMPQALSLNDLWDADGLCFINSNWGALAVDELTVDGQVRAYVDQPALQDFIRSAQTAFSC
jgi:4-amino-4-deoxychorismate lyase